MVLSNEAQGFIRDIKEVVYEADDLFDEFVTLLELKQISVSGSKKHNRLYRKVRSYFSSDESKFSQAYRMFRKVKEIQNKLNATVDNHTKFALTIDYKPISLRGEDSCSYVDVNDIVGRDDDKKIILEKLIESKDNQYVRFLTVVGVGGMGKTALAQLVYQDERTKQEFGDLRIWVCVSDQDKQHFDVKAILSKIVGVTSIDVCTLESLQNQFQEKFARKKFFLILDDVWNEDRGKWVDLEKFLRLGKEGSRVLVTKRSEMTATTIGDDDAHIYRLKGLSSKDSWELFKSSAHIGHNQSEEFMDIGKNIVSKCYNIPLAIKVVGSLLYGQDINQWKLFEKSGLAEIMKGDNKIMSILKLSYHNLETSLKSCFTYCAVFPKDFVIQREMLIRLWMAQGYIMPSHESESIEAAGQKYFLILLRRCFFQDVIKDKYGDVESVKIHDLMHDVAQEVAGEEIQISISNDVNIVKDKVCHFSFVGKTCPKSSSSKLRSYIHLYSHTITFCGDTIVDKLTCLRVLDLKFLNDSIKSVESISELIHLRYLDLSHTTFEILPDSSITKLHNLQTLILQHCRNLRELPHKLSKLLKLRHLDISGCANLTCMPLGMDKMTSLSVLTKYVVGKRSPIGKQCDGKLKDLESLVNLTGSISLDIGENYRNVEPMNGSYLSQLKDLKEVEIKFDTKGFDHEVVLEMLEPHPNLKGLILEGNTGKTFPWWQRFENNGAISHKLVNVFIRLCNGLQNMPSFSKLPYLKSLKLLMLSNLEYMEQASSTSNNTEAKETTFFPSLETLHIKGVYKLKGWFSGEALPDAGRHCSSRRFHHLSELEVLGCLTFAPIPPCPSIKSLTCDQSRRLKEVVGESDCRSCLNTLRISDDKELKSLSEIENEFMTCASSLTSLSIYRCNNLVNIYEGLEKLTRLESLTLSLNPQLSFSEDDIRPWISLSHSLRNLVLSYLSNVTCLPKGMQYLTSLNALNIQGCHKLKALPEWITRLSSLQHLEIRGNIQERCAEPDGIDWPKIKHIPLVIVSD